MRGVLPNHGRQDPAGLYTRVRDAARSSAEPLLVPEVAIGHDQQGDYLLG